MLALPWLWATGGGEDWEWQYPWGTRATGEEVPGPLLCSMNCLAAVSASPWHLYTLHNSTSNSGFPKGPISLPEGQCLLSPVTLPNLLVSSCHRIQKLRTCLSSAFLFGEDQGVPSVQNAPGRRTAVPWAWLRLWEGTSKLFGETVVFKKISCKLLGSSLEGLSRISVEMQVCWSCTEPGERAQEVPYS